MEHLRLNQGSWIWIGFLIKSTQFNAENYGRYKQDQAPSYTHPETVLKLLNKLFFKINKTCFLRSLILI